MRFIAGLIFVGIVIWLVGLPFIGIMIGLAILTAIGNFALEGNK
jgi:hypothetical protein